MDSRDRDDAIPELCSATWRSVPDAARRLRDAAVDGRLEALAEMNGLSLIVMFGSASRASGQRLGTEWMRRLDRS